MEFEKIWKLTNKFYFMNKNKNEFRKIFFLFFINFNYNYSSYYRNLKFKFNNEILRTGN